MQMLPTVQQRHRGTSTRVSDMDPHFLVSLDPDPHFDPDPKIFFLLFNVKNIYFWKKSSPGSGSAWNGCRSKALSSTAHKIKNVKIIKENKIKKKINMAKVEIWVSEVLQHRYKKLKNNAQDNSKIITFKYLKMSNVRPLHGKWCEFCLTNNFIVMLGMLKTATILNVWTIHRLKTATIFTVWTIHGLHVLQQVQC